MAVPQLRDRVLEDRLRAMEIRMAALERRTPVGDSLTFDADPTPGQTFPPYSLSAEYVRTNQLLAVWIEMSFTGPPPAPNSYPITFATPYPFDYVLGQWSVFWTSTNSIKQHGPVTGYLGASDRVWLHSSLVGTDIGGDVSVSRMLRNDFILGPPPVANDWKSGDRVTAVFTCRIPDGY